MVARYIFSGSLPEDATTYVTRKADTQLYEGLKAGKFCYVLNSRQTGKSSLRVHTMLRLREEGFSCVAIDLSFGGIQYVTPEQWYVDLLDTLIDSLALDVDLEDWWEDHELLSPLKRFRKLIEEVLLVEVRENIVIFIDEIDSVLSLNFPTDDFFAFIRACYNQRVDNPEYKRLSFCLLGVASPSELIADKKRTPFNIGQAIFLKGFELSEVEPLKKGLQGKVNDSTAVIKEILDWTGGQPFLTQKLCQFVVEESEREQPLSVEKIVRARIITNWESQDEPEHLKTIRDRILYRDEQRAGYLLELYQQIRQQGQTPLNDSIEQSELQLSGLVTKRQGKLFITNPIYREVFNQDWIDQQLGSLRPYSENFRAWVASGCQDESRLLRGQALILAEEWAKNKSLSYQDKEFLAAGRNLAIEEENKKAQLERDRQDKEAELERERQAREVAEQANQKAQRRIEIGTGVLIVTVLAAIISVVVALEQLGKIRLTTKNVDRLSQLSGELHKTGLTSAASQAREYIGLSYEIKNHEFKQAFLLASMSLACQNLDQKNCNEEPGAITESLKLLQKQENLYTDPIGAQVEVFAYYIQGQLFNKQDKPDKAIEAYTQAFNLLEKSKYNPYEPNISTKILSEGYVKDIHYRLIKSRNIDINSSDEIARSFREHLYDGLEFLLSEDQDRLQEADQETLEIMLYIADRWEDRYFTVESLQNFSCEALREIDQRWYDYPKRQGHFGFRVQKQIWESPEIGSPTINSPIEDWRKFYIKLGWKTEESGIESEEGYVSYEKLGAFKDMESSLMGNLPINIHVYGVYRDQMDVFSRLRAVGERMEKGRGTGEWLTDWWTRGVVEILFSRCEL